MCRASVPTPLLARHWFFLSNAGTHGPTGIRQYSGVPKLYRGSRTGWGLATEGASGSAPALPARHRGWPCEWLPARHRELPRTRGSRSLTGTLGLAGGWPLRGVPDRHRRSRIGTGTPGPAPGLTMPRGSRPGTGTRRAWGLRGRHRGSPGLGAPGAAPGLRCPYRDSRPVRGLAVRGAPVPTPLLARRRFSRSSPGAVRARCRGRRPGGPGAVGGGLGGCGRGGVGGWERGGRAVPAGRWRRRSRAAAAG